MQIAFRVKTDAAILGAGGVIADGADTHPAPSALPCHHPKLTASFSPQTRNATCGSPHFVQHKMIFRDNDEQARLVCDLAFLHP
jgi:hypothetical protein